MAKQLLDSATPVVTPKGLMQTIMVSLKANIPLFVEGSPGVGKSQIVHQAASAVAGELGEDFPVIELRGSTLDPVILGGLPDLAQDETVFKRPRCIPADGQGVIFIDELTSAVTPAVQAMLYQLVQDRQVGEHKLGDGWRIIGAGNLLSDKALASKMSTALRRRFWHVRLETDLAEWCEYAVEADYAIEVIAFLRFSPELLHDFDPTSTEANFPCPGTWELVSRLLKVTTDPDFLSLRLPGLIGRGAAAKFMGFLRVWKSMPSLDMILQNPNGAPTPDETDAGTMIALATGLSRRVDDRKVDAAITYLDRLPLEYSIMGVRDIGIRRPALQATGAFQKWQIRHQGEIR